MTSTLASVDERAAQVFKAIEALYNDEIALGPYIGEAVSQRAHALQAAYFGSRANASSAAILAALLHDVGHLIGMKNSLPSMGELGTQNHEGVGADYCRSIGLSETVCSLVRGHVQAKRYLCHANPDYLKKLSPASRGTLDHQGGPMSDAEAVAFDANPLKKEILLMRTWDEAAKVVDLEVPELNHYRAIIAENLAPLTQTTTQ